MRAYPQQPDAVVEVGLGASGLVRRFACADEVLVRAGAGPGTQARVPRVGGAAAVSITPRKRQRASPWRAQRRCFAPERAP